MVAENNHACAVAEQTRELALFLYDLEVPGKEDGSSKKHVLDLVNLVCPAARKRFPLATKGVNCDNIVKSIEDAYASGKSDALSHLFFAPEGLFGLSACAALVGDHHNVAVSLDSPALSEEVVQESLNDLVEDLDAQMDNVADTMSEVAPVAEGEISEIPEGEELLAL